MLQLATTIGTVALCI